MGQASRESNLDQLKKILKDKCNNEFPFLTKIYSPYSRVPCVDFTSWIIDQLEKNDINAIKILMRGIISANPGLVLTIGIGESNTSNTNIDFCSWIDEAIDSVLSIDFDSFLRIDEQAIKELQSIFILLSKNGGGRQFWLFNNANLISEALCFHSFSPNVCFFSSLINKANEIIKSMKDKGVPAWETLNYYDIQDIKLISTADIDNNEIVKIIKRMKISSRFHFFDALDYLNFGKPAISLDNATFYQTRAFGIDIKESAANLYHSVLFERINDYFVFSKIFSRDEIISFAECKSVDIKKEWNRKKLMTSILSTNEGKQYIQEIADSRRFCHFNTEFNEELQELNDYKNAIVKIAELLCFI